jgi:hypothetical protein
MGQKRSDFETIPLCNLHHDEQHRIGWKQFADKYGLNIRELLTVLNLKPRVYRGEYSYFMTFQTVAYRLNPIDRGGLKIALVIAQERRREWLIENVFTVRETTVT